MLFIKIQTLMAMADLKVGWICYYKNTLVGRPLQSGRNKKNKNNNDIKNEVQMLTRNFSCNQCNASTFVVFFFFLRVFFFFVFVFNKVCYLKKLKKNDTMQMTFQLGIKREQHETGANVARCCLGSRAGPVNKITEKKSSPILVSPG